LILVVIRLSVDFKDLESVVRAPKIVGIKAANLKEVGQLVLGGNSCEFFIPILAGRQRRRVKSADGVDFDLERWCLPFACLSWISVSNDSVFTLHQELSGPWNSLCGVYLEGSWLPAFLQQVDGRADLIIFSNNRASYLYYIVL
jgi:hypothetical protein